MKTRDISSVFDLHVAEYEAWYDTHKEAYLSELEAIREHFGRLPEAIRGIEVGLGTGRFAEPMGIKEGVEPSVPMAEQARKRGIEVMEGKAERLPYAAMQFDFVLFVTLCHLTKVERALEEALRVLKPGGYIIVGFLPEDQRAAQAYRERRKWSTFYKDARFYNPGYVEKLLKKLGFRDAECNQTLFGDPEALKEVQTPRSGYGEGSFVVISARKP